MNCPECNSTNLSKRGFRGKKQRYRCKDCGRYFVEGTKFVGRQVKLPVLKMSCPVCGDEKVIRDGLLETGGQRYKCVNCGKSFSNKTVVLAPVEYPCPYCGGKLKRSGHGKLGQPKYICTECGKSCSGEVPKVHETFQEKNLSVSCPHCDSKRIVLKGKVKGAVRYFCRDCERYFTDETKGRLERIKSEPRSNEVCPRCGGKRIIVAGVTKTGNQRYRCLSCRRTYTKGVKLIERDLTRKPPISDKDKRQILMYTLNVGLPISDVAKHFNCSEYAIKKLIKEINIKKC